MAARPDRGADGLARVSEGRAWAVGDAPPDFIAQQMRAIVGLEIEVADIRGKWKASQNRNEADRAGVVAGLEAEGSETALAMAKVVQRAANCSRAPL